MGKGHVEKRCEIQVGGQEMAVMVGDSATNSPELSLIKFLPFTYIYHHSHFLATNLDFTSFFTIAFLRATPFLQLGCFGLDTTSFCICIQQSCLICPAWCYFNLCFFLYYRKRRKTFKADFFILTIFDFIGNYTNFEFLHAISFLQDNLFVANLH